MKYTSLLGAMVLLALLLTACGPAAVTGVPTQVQPLATEIVSTVVPAATALAGPTTDARPISAVTPNLSRQHRSECGARSGMPAPAKQRHSEQQPGAENGSQGTGACLRDRDAAPTVFLRGALTY